MASNARSGRQKAGARPQYNYDEQEDDILSASEPDSQGESDDDQDEEDQDEMDDDSYKEDAQPKRSSAHSGGRAPPTHTPSASSSRGTSKPARSAAPLKPKASKGRASPSPRQSKSRKGASSDRDRHSFVVPSSTRSRKPAVNYAEPEEDMDEDEDMFGDDLDEPEDDLEEEEVDQEEDDEDPDEEEEEEEEEEEVPATKREEHSRRGLNARVSIERQPPKRRMSSPLSSEDDDEEEDEEEDEQDVDMDEDDEDNKDNGSLRDDEEGMEEDEEDDDEEIEVEDDIEMEDEEEDEEEDDIENTKPVVKPPVVKGAVSKGKKVAGALQDDEEEEYSDDDFSNPQQGMGFGGQLTKRQRSKLDVHDVSLELFELPVAASRKRLHTEEEMALKKSEITRRRKNQSAQRAEQDKLETINRLLKKQAGKRKKGAADDDEGGEDKKGVDGVDGIITAGGRQSNRYMTPPSYLRLTYTVDGTTLSIPEESLEHVPTWMQQAVQKMAVSDIPESKEESTPARKHVAIQLLETPIVPLKEPVYPAPKGQCEAPQCMQKWKYRGPKSRKVACGLEHLRVVEAS